MNKKKEKLYLIRHQLIDNSYEYVLVSASHFNDNQKNLTNQYKIMDNDGNFTPFLFTENKYEADPDDPEAGEKMRSQAKINSLNLTIFDGDSTAENSEAWQALEDSKEDKEKQGDSEQPAHLELDDGDSFKIINPGPDSTSSGNAEQNTQKPDKMFVKEHKNNAIHQKAWIIRPAKKTEKGEKLSTILEKFCSNRTTTPNITFVGFRESKEEEEALRDACDYIHKNYKKPQNPFGTLEVKDPVEKDLILPQTTAKTILINDTTQKGQGTLEQLTVSERIQQQKRQNNSDNQETSDKQETYVHIANAPKLKKLSVPKDAVVKFDQKVTKKTLDLSGVKGSITLEFYGGFDFTEIKWPPPGVTVNVSCTTVGNVDYKEKFKKLLENPPQDAGEFSLAEPSKKTDSTLPEKRVEGKQRKVRK